MVGITRSKVILCDVPFLDGRSSTILLWWICGSGSADEHECRLNAVYSLQSFVAPKTHQFLESELACLSTCVSVPIPCLDLSFRSSLMAQVLDCRDPLCLHAIHMA